MLSDEQVAEIKARCEAATEGPWVAEFDEQDGEQFDEAEATADFIAAAREDVPALLAHIDALTDENERLRELLREWTNMDPLRYDSENPCPWCNFDYARMQHEPDCAFVMARAECGIGDGSAALTQEANDGR